MLDRISRPDISGQRPASDRGDDTNHPLTCSKLTFSANAKPLINGIDISFSNSGMTAVMGFNGAGKSLLLRLLHGMIRPTSGEVLWNGQPASPSIRKKQAMVFQKPVLLRRTVLDNVQFVLKNRGVRDRQFAEHLLQKVGLRKFSSQAARMLSGGEQQRLSLARALACQPEVLFLDEATASLDPASISIIEQIIQKENLNGTKIIFVTHDIGQAKRLAAEVIFINAGKVAEQSSVEQFFSHPISADAKAYLAGRLPNEFN